MVAEDRIKQACADVCNTMKYYEDGGYTSVSRTPVDVPERCDSPEQFLEARLNFECFSIPELIPFVENLDGYLFKVIELKGYDKKRRKFKEAIVTLNLSPETYIGSEEYSDFWQALNSLLENESKCFKFSWANKKSRIKIEL